MEIPIAHSSNKGAFFLDRPSVVGKVVIPARKMIHSVTHQVIHFFELRFFFFKLLIYIFLGSAGSLLFPWGFSRCGYSLVTVRQLIAVASLVSGNRFWSEWASVIAAHKLNSCGVRV